MQVPDRVKDTCGIDMLIINSTVLNEFRDPDTHRYLLVSPTLFSTGRDFPFPQSNSGGRMRGELPFGSRQYPPSLGTLHPDTRPVFVYIPDIFHGPLPSPDIEHE